MYKLLENCSGVVILGTDAQTNNIIKSLNRDYGIRPLLYSNRRPPLWNIFLQYKFVKQLFPYNYYYTVHSIMDIVNPSNGGSWLLVPITSHFKKLLQNNKDSFEKTYIIPDLPTLIHALPSYKNSDL